MFDRSRRCPALALVAPVLLLAVASCASVLEAPPSKALVVTDDGSLFARFAPIFVTQGYARPYNRIGTPTARRDARGREEAAIDPASATIYARRDEFKTARGAYTNLVYRVHFQRVPPWHLTVGHNVGVFVILTLNEKQQPVLVTTVHTCGCYLAVVPTSYLPREAWPRGWTGAPQDVYGETHPGLLLYPRDFDPTYRPVIVFGGPEHRATGIRLQSAGEAPWRYDVLPARLAPMDALDRLPVDGSTTSFFHTEGRRKGYVKGSVKPLEMLLMGAWAFDFWVGRDKRLGRDAADGPTFYTSLKFWRRGDSDLRRFAECLAYWGWRL